MSKRHRKHDEDRALTRDEVYVPEQFGGYVGEIHRDNAYANYAIVRWLTHGRGWVGKAIAVVLLLLFAWFLVSQVLSWL